MKNFIRGFTKWVLAGIGIGVGIFIVLVAIKIWDNKNKQDTLDDTSSVFSNDADNVKEDKNEPLSQ